MAPALFVAGFSLPAANLQRVFAIVELMRAVAAFMIAPVFAHFAATVGGGPVAGTGIALWIGLGFAIGGAASPSCSTRSAERGRKPLTCALHGRRGGRWYSPPLLAGVRDRPIRALAEEAARP